ERLREMLEEAEGWDIIHVSGHGAPGELLLETDDGSPDRVPTADLVELLKVARKRLKLVTVSACWSAGLTAAEQRRRLCLPGRARRGPGGRGGPEAGGGGGAGDGGAGAGLPASPGGGDGGAAGSGGGDGAARALAAELAGRLGCAVLAMRYPVTDEFAIGLAG